METSGVPLQTKVSAKRGALSEHAGGGRVVLTQGIASRDGRNRDDYIVTAFWILLIGAIISSLSLIALAPLIAPLVFNADDAGTIGLVRWTALPVALAVLLAIVGYQRKKIKRQDEVIETHEKKDEITEGMREAEKQIDKEAEDAKDSIDDSDWRNRI